MKRITILALTCLLLSSLQISAQTKSKLKKVLELKMPKTASDLDCGTNGASVAWHPEQKKYYASFAGNSNFPFGVFDVKGKRLSEDNLTAMEDVRGLWYNPVLKTLEGNPYNNANWFYYTLDDNGIISKSTADIEYDYDEYNLPDIQSAGTFDTLKKKVAFLKNGFVDYYNIDDFWAFVDKSTKIYFGKKSTPPTSEEPSKVTPEEYNSTSLIYTGIKKAELGFLNVDQKQIELYDDNTGLLTKILTLPKDASVENVLNFAYSNKTYWLFDITKRAWKGYK